MVAVRADLHGGRGRRDRRGGLTAFRRQPRAAGADPARDRPADGRPGAWRVGGGRAADGDPRLLLRPEPRSSSPWRATACLPASLARVSKRGAPVRITIFTAVVTSRHRRR